MTAPPDDPADLAADLARQAAHDPPWPAQRFAGRGIVICAGGARMFTCAWVTIAVLRRHLGCTLPVEVWHLGRREMGPPMRGLLEDLGAVTVDAHEVAKRHPVRRLGGWELKAYALLHTRFAEVLLLDADNLPVRDPGFLFDCTEYRATGALFWPDIVRLTPANQVWRVGNIPYRDMPSFESGQMVLDKKRSWRPLSLAHWINQRAEAFYRFLHGDKDTFLLAWLVLQRPFHLIGHAPKELHGTLCQRDPDGAVLFQHRNWRKWILHGDNPHIAGFRLEDECRALLAELAASWDGRVFNPPPRSAAARRTEARLATLRHFVLTRVSSDERAITLLPDHRVGSAVLIERYWFVADAPDGLALHLAGEGVPVAQLREEAGGIWRGRLAQHPFMPVEIAPAARRPLDPAPDPPPAEDVMAALLDRVLATAAALPAEREVMRDLVGALRLLSALSPDVATWLAQRQAAGNAAEARLLAVARAALAVAIPVTPGRDWLGADFTLATGYERR